MQHTYFLTHAPPLLRGLNLVRWKKKKKTVSWNSTKNKIAKPRKYYICNLRKNYRIRNNFDCAYEDLAPENVKTFITINIYLPFVLISFYWQLVVNLDYKFPCITEILFYKYDMSLIVIIRQELVQNINTLSSLIQYLLCYKVWTCSPHAKNMGANTRSFDYRSE